jgi:hypothetical protein
MAETSNVADVLKNALLTNSSLNESRVFGGRVQYLVMLLTKLCSERVCGTGLTHLQLPLQLTRMLQQSFGQPG